MAQAIVRLLGDPALRASLGEAGRRRIVEAYGWPPRLRQLDHLIAARPNRPAAEDAPCAA